MIRCGLGVMHGEPPRGNHRLVRKHLHCPAPATRNDIGARCLPIRSSDTMDRNALGRAFVFIKACIHIPFQWLLSPCIVVLAHAQNVVSVFPSVAGRLCILVDPPPLGLCVCVSLEAPSWSCQRGATSHSCSMCALSCGRRRLALFSSWPWGYCASCMRSWLLVVRAPVWVAGPAIEIH